jgi:hypothetical protein
MTDQPRPSAALYQTGHLDPDQWRTAVTENLAALRGLLDGIGATLPGALPPAADTPEWRQAVGMCLSSVNDLIPELVSVTSDSPEFAGMVADVFRICSWSLGFTWRGERAPANWVPPWKEDPEAYEASW